MNTDKSGSICGCRKRKEVNKLRLIPLIFDRFTREIVLDKNGLPYTHLLAGETQSQAFQRVVDNLGLATTSFDCKKGPTGVMPELQSPHTLTEYWLFILEPGSVKKIKSTTISLENWKEVKQKFLSGEYNFWSREEDLGILISVIDDFVAMHCFGE